MSVLRKRKMIAIGPDLSKFEGEDGLGESYLSSLELFSTLICAVLLAFR
jgi:hypothetical protein